jgi:predicted nucleic acid-binding protein
VEVKLLLDTSAYSGFRRGVPINDVWIAAQAMEHGAELLTSDRHFEQVAGLAFTIC